MRNYIRHFFTKIRHVGVSSQIKAPLLLLFRKTAWLRFRAKNIRSMLDRFFGFRLTATCLRRCKLRMGAEPIRLGRNGNAYFPTDLMGSIRLSLSNNTLYPSSMLSLDKRNPLDTSMKNIVVM